MPRLSMFAFEMRNDFLCYFTMAFAIYSFHDPAFSPITRE